MPLVPPTAIAAYPQEQTQQQAIEPESTATADPIPPAPSITDPGDSGTFTPALVSSDQSSGDWYSEATLDGEYEIDPGILQVPVAGPAGTPCEIIAVHAPTCTRVFEWTVERVNSPPKAPSWLTNNPNEVLSSRKINPASWIMGPDGTKIYRLSGRYEYALFLPPGDGDPLFTGVPQYAVESPSSANVQPSQFDTSLSDSSSTVPAGFTPSALT